MFRLRHPLLYTFAENSTNNSGSSTKLDLDPKKGEQKLKEYLNKNKPQENSNESTTGTKNQHAVNTMKFGSGGGDKAGSFNNPIKVTSSSTEEQNKTELAKKLNGRTLSAPGGSSASRNGEENKEINKAQNSNVSSMLGVSDDEVTNAYTEHNKSISNNNNNNNGNGQAQNQQSGGDNQQPEERNLVEDVKDGLGNLKDEWGRTVGRYTSAGGVQDETKYNPEAQVEVDKAVKKSNKSTLNTNKKLSDGAQAVRNEMKTKELNAEDAYRKAKRGTGVTGWAAAGGAVLGAVGRYRQALKEWEYECQRAAAEGRPMPKKPSLLGSALVGGATGAIGGAALGAVSKRVSSRMGNLDKNLKMQGKMKNLNRKSIEDGVDYAKDLYVSRNLTEEQKMKLADLQYRERINKGASYIKNAKKQLDKGENITQEQLNYFTSLQRSDEGFELLKKIFGQNADIQKIRDYWQSKTYNFSSLYDHLAYIGQCFSLVEDLEEKANKDVEDWKELYNFYILNICDEPIPVNDFLLECYYYPSFINYVEDAIVNFYQKKLITFSSLGGIQKELDQYQSLYNEYRNLVGTNLTATEFMDRCITYDSYVEYIHDKIRRTRLRRLGAMHFANPQSTSLPQNIQIDGQNIDTTQQGLPDPKDANSMQNQNSIQNKQQDAKNRQAQLEQQKQEQQKKQQIEANKANYAKEQHAKEVNEINKLTQKKAEISKNLGRNASDMPMQQLAQEKQKITDLNFKIQNVKSETKNKIANYKGKSSKQFSLRKPV